MQVERIRALADLIEQQPHTDQQAESGFNMESWEHSCGTPCCIGGWMEHEFGWQKHLSFTEYADLLNISYEDAKSLFCPSYVQAGLWSKITPSHAAAVLRHLADHGVVDWTVGVSR